ncbi:MAG: RsmB/NOP family class I SAM-dependent RNA methyltransferase [Hyphomicrobiales bacterium]
MASSSKTNTRSASQVGLPARRAAIKALKNILKDKQPLEGALERASLSALHAKDRALARSIVTTALRRKGQLDDALNTFIEKPLGPKGTGLTYEALLAGAAQILFMRVPAHAAIDLSARVLAYDPSGGRKFVGFLNAVLRNLDREGDAALAGQDEARLNTPGWLYESWTKAYGGDGARAIALAHLKEAPLDLTVKEDAATWAEKLGGHVLAQGSIRLDENPGKVTKLDGFEEGAWWVQDVAASLPARLLGTVKGKRVFDLCAAPGGKTSQLAHAGAEVIAVDSSPDRMERVRENLKRLQLDAETVTCDVMDFAPDELADAILLDAPCSSTGTIRRHPDVAYLKTRGSIKVLAKTQGEMLRKAETLLKPGGTLIYCTCSLQPEEGEKQIAQALKRGGLERVAISKEEIGALAEAITHDGDVRTVSSMGMDGFFISRLRRV